MPPVLPMLLSFSLNVARHLTVGGQIAIWIVALTASLKKLIRLQIGELWSSNS